MADHHERFEQFIAPVNRRQPIWLVIVGGLFLAFVYFALVVAVLAVWAALIPELADQNMAEALGQVMVYVSEPHSPLAIIIVLSSFVGMALACFITVAAFHQQHPRTLFGPGSLLVPGAIGAGVLLGITAIASFIDTGTGPMVPNVPMDIWLSWIWLAVPLLLVQVTAEELVFRGYLMQQLAARFRSRWVWQVLPAVVFGAGHYDPTHASNVWLIMLATTLMGLFLAEVTYRTGNLGAAIGIHFANNFVALLLVSLDGGLSGLSLYKTPFSAADHDILRTQLVLEIGLLCLIFAVFFFIWDRVGRK